MNKELREELKQGLYGLVVGAVTCSLGSGLYLYLDHRGRIDLEERNRRVLSESRPNPFPLCGGPFGEDFDYSNINYDVSFSVLEYEKSKKENN